MKQLHTKGVKIPGTVRASPSPGGEGRGEGERFLQSHFRSRRRIKIRVTTEEREQPIRVPNSRIGMMRFMATPCPVFIGRVSRVTAPIHESLLSEGRLFKTR